MCTYTGSHECSFLLLNVFIIVYSLYILRKKIAAKRFHESVLDCGREFDSCSVCLHIIIYLFFSSKTSKMSGHGQGSWARGCCSPIVKFQLLNSSLFWLIAETITEKNGEFKFLSTIVIQPKHVKSIFIRKIQKSNDFAAS